MAWAVPVKDRRIRVVHGIAWMTGGSRITRLEMRDNNESL
jgi:hypothetical protein